MLAPKQVERIHAKEVREALNNGEGRVAAAPLELPHVRGRELDRVCESFLAEPLLLAEPADVQPQGLRQSHNGRRLESGAPNQSL